MWILQRETRSSRIFVWALVKDCKAGSTPQRLEASLALLDAFFGEVLLAEQLVSGTVETNI